MRRCARLALLLVCLCSLPACGPAQPKTQPAVDYARLLQLYDGAIVNARKELQRSPNEVSDREALSLALLQKALLTSNFQDYADADRAMADAFAISDDAHAPLLSRLHLNLVLHRLPQAEADRARLASRFLVADTAGFAGESAELAFQQGRYAEALAGFHRSLAIQEGLFSLFRLAIWYARTGDCFEAAALIDRAEKQDHSDTPYLHAWLELQHGLLLLDRGRWEQADEYFYHAESLLPGWWLPRSRHAQVLALKGEREEAQALYETLVTETGDPEFMDAVARLRRVGPDPASAAPWIQRAAAVHRQRLALLPEAEYAHALEHELWFGHPEQALDLAQRNAELRPNGEARTLLAEALYKAGKTAEAQHEIEAVLATAWNTAESHAIAAQIAAALGQREEADRQQALAIDLNPRAFRMYPLPQPAQPEALP
ncbi:tetratricopeptide repeat protein [Nevskia soli]|uniref:tetratricopeptide repeat protein n=1 Tax=Nevskia soli TaxID=418856 RepID=UPI0012F881B2|nr:hypothetical protein [Nevskia soli]